MRWFLRTCLSGFSALVAGICTVRVGATTYYVDINSTNPTPPYATWSTAATNIQDAVDAASGGDTVVVTDGVYQAGGYVTYGTMLNRVAVTKPITVESINGPSKTTILGYSGVRCAYLTTNTLLTGFTLNLGNIAGSDVHDVRGAGVYAESGAVISNCVISGSVAYTSGGTNDVEGGGLYGGTAIDCLISANGISEGSNGGEHGGGAAFSTLTNCVLFENSSTLGGGAHECTLENCTVVANSAEDGGGVADCEVDNSIVYFNTSADTNGYPNYFDTTFSYSCTTPDPGGTGNITNDPGFVNPGNNDYHLQLGSPCINAGNNALVGTATDIDGHPRIVAGIVDIGSYEYQAAIIDITAQPATQTNLFDDTAILSVDAVSAYALSYQWFFNSNSIPGATNSNLIIPNIQFTNAGAYFVAISNEVLTTNSAAAELSVFYPPPLIVQQPTNLAVLVGSNTVISVMATSYLDMTFQWQLNGTNLEDGGQFSGSTNSALSILGAMASDAGNYDVIVSDSEWSVTSAVATVSILFPVGVTLQPTNQTVVVPGNVSLAAAASGTGPLDYQWFFNGTPLTDGGRISGSASATLNISSVQVTNGGLYQLLVTNNFSTATSTVVMLTVEAPVTIIGQPASESVTVGGEANFSVTATGTDLGYQWFYKSFPLSDNGRIIGSATASLSITNIDPSDAGDYWVVVSNNLNTATSSSATLTPLAGSGPSIRYINLNNLNPASPYLTWQTAATNIQTAIDAAVDGDEIIVTDGVYQIGGETVNGFLLTNRVVINKAITLQSVNGPSNTFIVGGQNAEYGSSGPGAIRCVWLGTNATLIGFTLTNGATLYSGDATNQQSGGGVFCATINSSIVSNCVIVANTADNQGGGAFQGTLLNCIIADNQSIQTGGGGAANGTLVDCSVIGNNTYYGGGGGLANATAFMCLITSNSASNPYADGPSYGGYGGGAYNSAVFNSALAGNLAAYAGGGAYGGTLVNCTVTANLSTGQFGGTANCVATNSIIYYNSCERNPGYSNSDYGPFSYCCTAPMPAGTGNITADPGLADISHISLNSPCRGAGNPVAATGVDIDGNAWNNPPSIGCSEIPAGGDYGNLIASISVAFTNWAQGYPLNFQTANTGPDYMTVWNFGDGTIVTNAAYISHTWPASGSYPLTLTAYNDSYPTGVTARAMMTILVPATNYVNNANPNPVPPYMYWSTASADIQDAVSAAVPGATVLVTNALVHGQFPYTNIFGLYETGGAYVGGAFYRVAITNPITVESVNGPGVTLIDGGFLANNGQTRGGGVYMTNGAVLSGFTVTNGASEIGGIGGVWASSTNAMVTNCIITHCQGGGAYSGTFYNCSILGNGGGSVMSTLNSCVLSNNSRAYGGGALGGILNGCLIVSNAATYGGGAFGGNTGAGTYPLLVNNCLISNNAAQYGGGIAGYAGYDPNFTNCILTNCTLAFNVANPYGGGAFDAQLDNCIISSNKSLEYGGGISGGLASNCSILGNVAPDGGGAWNDNSSQKDTTLNNCSLIGNAGGGAGYSVLNQCLVLENFVARSAGAGGGVDACIVNNSQILTNEAYYGGGVEGGSLTNCLIAGNVANYGGGADGGYQERSPPRFTILDNCTLAGNFATNTGGGAIECTLEQCTVTNNMSEFAGGGAAHAILDDCVVLNNSALGLDPDPRNPISGGGGAYACAITNCILANNFATTNGGGAFQSTLVNCTITENTALIGGGSFDSTNFNTILYYNNGGDYYPSTTQYPLNYCCAAALPTNGLRNIIGPPLFVNLGGGDFHLPSSSPCINSGENAYIAGNSTDLDGDPRIAAGTVDIGAYEYQTLASVISYAYLQQYGLPADGSVDFADLDGTGLNVYQDWIADLNPTNSASVLAMLTPAVTNSASGATVSWQSVNGIPYLVQRSTNLTAQPFATIQNVTGQTGTTSYTDASATNGVPYFYRVGVAK